MGALTRLWIVTTSPSGELADDAPPGLSDRTLHALAGPPGEALAQLGSTCPGVRMHELPELASAGPSLLAALTRVAADSTGREVALVLPPDAARHVLAAVLSGPRAVAPAPGSLIAVDWPDGSEGDVHPQCIGVDLDWWPPWQAGKPSSRYPGGPGAAGTARG